MALQKFDRRMAHLEREVGWGKITAKCVVNQPYAQNQHQTDHFRHTNGRSHYLGGPLLEHAFELIEGLARAAITPLGTDIHGEMVDIAETMSRYVWENAPKDTGRLSMSGHPSVSDNGRLIYDRPAIAPRMTR
jgi:hypothetical protein